GSDGKWLCNVYTVPTLQYQGAKPNGCKEVADGFGNGAGERFVQGAGRASGTRTRSQHVAAMGSPQCIVRLLYDAGTGSSFLAIEVQIEIGSQMFAPDRIVGSVDYTIFVKITRQQLQICNQIRYEHTLATVGESGPEDELSQVVETT